jgi:uncharacterized protein
MWLETLGVGLVFAFMLIGFIGAFVPLLPGTLFVWLTVLVYSVVTRFTLIEPSTFVFITVIAFVTGTADIWLSLIGAKVGGANPKSLLWGACGAVIGFIIFNLLGALIGYALGIIGSEYRRGRDWRLALKASVGGVIGWGVSTAVEAGGALIIILIFIWKVMLSG